MRICDKARVKWGDAFGVSKFRVGFAWAGTRESKVKGKRFVNNHSYWDCSIPHHCQGSIDWTLSISTALSMFSVRGCVPDIRPWECIKNYCPLTLQLLAAAERCSGLWTSVQRSNPIQPIPSTNKRSTPFYGDLKQNKADPAVRPR